MRQLRLAEMVDDLPIIVSILCDVPYPRQSLIPTLFYNLQISNLNTGYGEIGNFKFNSDWGAFFEVLFCEAGLARGAHREAKDHVPLFTLGRPKCARIRNSRDPPSCLIFHTNADLSGAYCTLPVDA